MGLLRLTVTASLCAAGCVAPNPAFNDTTGSGGAPSSSTGADPTGNGTGTSGYGTSGTGEMSGSSESTGSAASTGTSTGDPSSTDESGRPTDPSAPVLLWVTAAVTGDFRLVQANICESALVSLDEVGACQSPPILVVGRGGVALSDLPGSHSFLAEGEVVTVGSREPLADNFAALAASEVSSGFVMALSGPPPKLSVELTLWWGPIDAGGADPSCADWMDLAGMGATRSFTAGQSSGSQGLRLCENPHRVLCACPGLP